MSNHLGNVLCVVSDRKLPKALSPTPNLVNNYVADVLSSTDYAAFGAPLSGRQYNSGTYRYGFNGKENDNDVKGVVGSQQDYGLRIYDSRLGKFLSVDPLAKDYPWNSAYAFAENGPIENIDLDGGERKSYVITLRTSSIIQVADYTKIQGKWHGPLGAGISLYIINEKGKQIGFIFKPDNKSWKDILGVSKINPIDKIITSNLAEISERNAEIKSDERQLKKMKEAHEIALDADLMDLTEFEAACLHFQLKAVELQEARNITTKKEKYDNLNKIAYEAIDISNSIKKNGSKEKIKIDKQTENKESTPKKPEPINKSNLTL